MNNVTYTIEIEPEEYRLALAETWEHTIEANNWLKEIDQQRNTWQWCNIKVTARYYDYKTGVELIGTDTLGCCSYADEDDFRAGGYYDDMCDNALADCKSRMLEVIALAEKLKPLTADFVKTIKEYTEG